LKVKGFGTGLLGAGLLGLLLGTGGMAVAQDTQRRSQAATGRTEEAGRSKASAAARRAKGGKALARAGSAEGRGNEAGENEKQDEKQNGEIEDGARAESAGAE